MKLVMPLPQETQRAEAASRADYLSGYLDLLWQTDIDAGLRTWIEAFQQALDNWQEAECSRLLREIKRAPFTAEVQQVARYAEGQLAEQQGNFNRAIDCYRTSLTLARAGGHRLREAIVLADLGKVYHDVGLFAAAIEQLQAALDIYRDAGASDEATVEVLNRLGAVYTHMGRWEDALACFEEGLALTKTPEDRAALLTNLGTWYQERGEPDLAMRQYGAALEIYQTMDNPAEQTLLLNNLGLLALAQHQLTTAFEHLTDALALFQTRQDWSGTTRTLGNLALAAYATGDLLSAVHYGTEAIESARSLGDRQALSIFLSLRGILYIDLGRWEAAVADLRQGLDLAQQAEDQPAEVVALNNLGTGYRHLQQFDEARACYEAALTLAEELGHQRRLGEINGNLGHLYHELADIEQARNYYKQSVTLAEQSGDWATACNSLLDLGGIALMENDSVTLRTVVERALEFSDIAGQPDLLIRLRWLQGDLAMLEGNEDAIFAAYGEAVIFAAGDDNDLLDATLERIAFHLNYLEPETVEIICQRLRAAWAEASLLPLQPTLSQWLSEQAADSDM